eukprot:CAMPEP_0175074078 /NCGR_PEP_ID=MMETSP0052_2-20121109/21047_1 /TAXON_ID=51329 ORGANISM="Polytomella parva, Strain SAG 63-3" /NCGR_SAMPLE_ID=MMETSP0052_2 /ASSEMBLY_ACC=CAM_ASM_000194 /LENGTH=99 /DNA_ID=CAMNT_0016342217 /DNA_START=12 /DNA_END=308 /DNA_ORIENTATION=+
MDLKEPEDETVFEVAATSTYKQFKAFLARQGGEAEAIDESLKRSFFEERLHRAREVERRTAEKRRRAKDRFITVLKKGPYLASLFSFSQSLSLQSLPIP